MEPRFMQAGAAVCATALVALGAAQAQSPAVPPSLTGTWRGISAMQPQQPVTVQLEWVGDKAIRLRYGAPRSCLLTAEILAAEDSGYRLALKGSNGGYCDRLMSATLTLQPADADHLRFEVRLRNRQVADNGDLQRVAPQPGRALTAP